MSLPTGGREKLIGLKKQSQNEIWKLKYIPTLKKLDETALYTMC